MTGILYSRVVRMGVALLLTLSFLASTPTVVEAYTRIEISTSALSSIMRGVLSIEKILNISDISQLEQKSITDVIHKIRNDTVLLAALNAEPGVTAEIILYPNDLYAQAQIITYEGVKQLDFYFDHRIYAAATDKKLVAEVVRRAAQTLNLSEDLLASGAVIVNSFSGISTPEISNDGSSVSLPGSTNLKWVKVTGSVQDFSAKVTVRTGSGVDADGNTVPANVVSYDYAFSPSVDDSSIMERTEELRGRIIKELSDELGLPPEEVNKKVTQWTLSKFDNVDQVNDYVYDHRLDNEELIKMAMDVGINSVITDGVIRFGGEKGFVLAAKSDQNETLSFRVSQYLNEGGDYDGMWTGRYNSYISYQIYGSVVGVLAAKNVSYSHISNGIRSVLGGVDSVFSVPENDIITDVSRYVISNTSAFVHGPFDPPDYIKIGRTTNCAMTSHSYEVIDKILAYMTQDRQRSSSIPKITTFYMAQRKAPEETFFLPCEADNRALFRNTR